MQGHWFVDSGTGLWKRESPERTADVGATPVEIDILSKPRALVLDTLLANVPRQDDSDGRDTYDSDNDDDEAYETETAGQFWQDLGGIGRREQLRAFLSRGERGFAWFVW